MQCCSFGSTHFTPGHSGNVYVISSGEASCDSIFQLVLLTGSALLHLWDSQHLLMAVLTKHYCSFFTGYDVCSQYPGWSQMDDGSIRVAEVTEDSLGTYTCMPYNALGSMGWSPPAPLVLKVCIFK